MKLLILIIILFILIAGCAAPLSTIGNDITRSSLSSEVLNVTIIYALGGVVTIPFSQNCGNYTIHAETISHGYSATIGYQYSTKSPNDRFGNGVNPIVHGWKSLTSGGDGYIGYSNEYFVIDNTFSIPPDSQDSIIIIVCKSDDGIAMFQQCGTKISISRVEE